jgi:hypothetical protein
MTTPMISGSELVRHFERPDPHALRASGHSPSRIRRVPGHLRGTGLAVARDAEPMTPLASDQAGEDTARGGADLHPARPALPIGRTPRGSGPVNFGIQEGPEQLEEVPPDADGLVAGLDSLAILWRQCVSTDPVEPPPHATLARQWRVPGLLLAWGLTPPVSVRSSRLEEEPMLCTHQVHQISHVRPRRSSRPSRRHQRDSAGRRDRYRST